MSETVDPKTFRVRDLPSIWDYELNQQWLVKNLIPSSSVIMLSGESGSGKSTLSLALAHAVATGESFLGHETQKTPALIVDRENNASIYKERLDRLDIEKTDDLLIWGHFSPLEPPTPNSKSILEFVQEEHPLIIYDSFVAFHPGSEQDADETRTYMDFYRKLAGMGATVVIIHHTGKGENTKEYRGSSDIKASIDVGFVLNAKRPLLKLLELKPFKCREGNPEKIQITLDGTKFVAIDTQYVEPEDEDWKLVVACVKENPGMNQGQLIKLLETPTRSSPKIRKVLMAGELKGTFRVEKGPRNASMYWLGDGKNAQ